VVFFAFIVLVITYFVNRRIKRFTEELAKTLDAIKKNVLKTKCGGKCGCNDTPKKEDPKS
jgi:uncharacterized protein YoxC